MTRPRLRSFLRANRPFLTTALTLAVVLVAPFVLAVVVVR